LAEAVDGAQTIITLLGAPQEVEDVYLGEGGVLENAAPASLFIDLSTSNPKLVKEIYALATVHDHRFVEAPVDGDVDYIQTGNYKLYAAGEPDNLAAARPILGTLAQEVLEVGLPGSGVALKLASRIALAGAMMGVVEATSFALASGVDSAQILTVLNNNPYVSTLAQAFGQRIITENFYYGLDLNRFFSDLEKALTAADEAGVALPGLETAHQLYDLLVLVGGRQRGIHALALIYFDEERCAKHGLNWALAQKAMDVYERAGDEAYDDFYPDDEDCDDPDCKHHHGDENPPGMGHYFSHN
jgi:3-hydroxyisobutyrate dehydrogenase